LNVSELQSEAKWFVPLQTLADKKPEMTMTNHDRVWLEESIKHGKREIFHEIITLRPAMASAILDLNQRNRRFSHLRAAAYAAIITDGRWKVTHQGLALDKNGVLIDGQHRCGAVVLANKPVRVMISFGWEPENFTLVDTGAKRSSADLVSIDGMQSSTLRASVARMIHQIRTRDTMLTPDPNLIVSLCRELADDDMEDALKFGMSVAGHRLMTPTGGALAMWVILKNTKHMARLAAFKEGMLLGTDLAKTSPILRAREHIRHLPKSSKGTGIKQAAGVIMAWNAYIKGRQLNSMAWPHVVELPEAL